MKNHEIALQSAINILNNICTCTEENNRCPNFSKLESDFVLRFGCWGFVRYHVSCNEFQITSFMHYLVREIEIYLKRKSEGLKTPLSRKRSLKLIKRSKTLLPNEKITIVKNFLN